jgi:hypothetical protein
MRDLHNRSGSSIIVSDFPIVARLIGGIVTRSYIFVNTLEHLVYMVSVFAQVRCAHAQLRHDINDRHFVLDVQVGLHVHVVDETQNCRCEGNVD